MIPSKSAVPDRYRTVSASLTVRNAAKAIEFYKNALGAEELMRLESPDGTIGHAEIRIGNSIVFIGEEMPGMGNRSPESLGAATGGLYLYVEDADKALQRAIEAGGTQKMPPTDMFWGDRYAQFADPFGYSWGLSTRKWEMTPAELDEGAKAFWAQMAQAQKKMV